MEYIVGDNIGLLHLIFACLSLLFGTMVLILRKGTQKHKKIGYLYLISMAMLIATSFMIFRLFDGWGVFHYLAVLSLVTILLGMIPIWVKRPVNAWGYFHFSFMYWSVIGLYSAFAAELLVRIPETPFLVMVGVATGVIMGIGGFFFGRDKVKWRKIFSHEKNE